MIGTLTELLVLYQQAECPVVDISVLSLSPGLPSCLTVSQTDSQASRQQLHVVHSNQLSEEASSSSSQQDPLVRLTTVVTVLAWWSHRGSATTLNSKSHTRWLHMVVLLAWHFQHPSIGDLDTYHCSAVSEQTWRLFVCQEQLELWVHLLH